MSDAERYTENGIPVRYGLPQEVQYCTKCVISNQRPSSVKEFENRPDAPKATIMFDEEGVCASCRYAEIKENEIDWEARERELWSLCEKYRSRNGS